MPLLKVSTAESKSGLASLMEFMNSIIPFWAAYSMASYADTCLSCKLLNFPMLWHKYANIARTS